MSEEKSKVEGLPFLAFAVLREEQPAASGSEWGLEHPWRRAAVLWCESKGSHFSKGAGAAARPHAEQARGSRCRPLTLTQISSKRATDLSVTRRTTTVLQDGGVGVADSQPGSDFPKAASEPQAVKEKVGEQGLVKTVYFSSMKGAVQRMKRRTAEWEEPQPTLSGAGVNPVQSACHSSASHGPHRAAVFTAENARVSVQPAADRTGLRCSLLRMPVCQFSQPRTTQGCGIHC